MNNLEIAKSSFTNGKATAALIFGILSIVLSIVPLVGLILAIIGLVIGFIGLQEIKRFEQDGNKIAIAGIVCSILGILLPIILSIVGYMAFTNITSL